MPDDETDDIRETIARAIEPSFWNEWGYHTMFNIVMREASRQKADRVLAELGLGPDGPNAIVPKKEARTRRGAPLRRDGTRP